MKKFKVYYTSLTTHVIEVEARDEAEAYNIARETDGGDFEEVGVGDWEYQNSSEIK